MSAHACFSWALECGFGEAKAECLECEPKVRHTGGVAKDPKWQIGSTADHARFTRERAQALTPEQGLTVLEELRSMMYDDPEAPPRLERIFVLGAIPALPQRRRARSRK